MYRLTFFKSPLGHSDFFNAFEFGVEKNFNLNENKKEKLI